MKAYDFTVKAQDGSEVSLKDYEGKALLIVNTATGCGFTPQYEELQAMYEELKEQSLSVKQLGAKLYLDSGTLTPVLKTLEKKVFLKRERSKEDERNLIVTLTEKGELLKDKAVTIPQRLAGCLELDRESAAQLYTILHKLMENF